MERIKLNAAARNQLTTLKRRTGIEHNNAVCRHALCISLANPSVPPDENFSFSGTTTCWLFGCYRRDGWSPRILFDKPLSFTYIADYHIL
jgi:hypothetical protein